MPKSKISRTRRRYSYLGQFFMAIMGKNILSENRLKDEKRKAQNGYDGKQGQICRSTENVKNEHFTAPPNLRRSLTSTARFVVEYRKIRLFSD